MAVKIDRYYTLREISQLTGANVSLLRALCATGLLPAVRWRLGSKGPWHVRARDLREWIEDMEDETHKSVTQDGPPAGALRRLGHLAGKRDGGGA